MTRGGQPFQCEAEGARLQFPRKNAPETREVREILSFKGKKKTETGDFQAHLLDDCAADVNILSLSKKSGGGEKMPWD